MKRWITENKAFIKTTLGTYAVSIGVRIMQIMRLILTSWRFKSGKWTRIEV